MKLFLSIIVTGLLLFSFQNCDESSLSAEQKNSIKIENSQENESVNQETENEEIEKNILLSVSYYKGGWFSPPEYPSWKHDSIFHLDNSSLKIKYTNPHLVEMNVALTLIEIEKIRDHLMKLETEKTSGPIRADGGTEFILLTFDSGKQMKIYLDSAEAPEGSLKLKDAKKSEELSKILSDIILSKFGPSDLSCPLEYKPLCGADGRTYTNKCDLGEIEMIHEGECKKVCPEIIEPVCSKNNITYMNECIANGEPIAYKGECKDSPPVSCTKEYAPVCGKDGMTYGNACMAKANNVEISYTGACKKACTKEYAPVCGKDGKTYGNACMAKVNNVEISYTGACKKACTKEYAPVCGKDGKTYGNACMAKVNNVEVSYTGVCKKACTKEYAPVCGKNGKTYGNACMAKVDNIEIAYTGKCN